MNFKMDLSTNQKYLLEQIDIKVENRKYTKEEIKDCIDSIANHIMSKSTKNGDLDKEIIKYNGLINLLVKYESD